MCTFLKLYQGSGNFEERFLHETREAYHAEGSRMVNSEDFTVSKMWTAQHILYSGSFIAKEREQ